MKDKIEKYIQEMKEDNKGIALLFTLGILGILLVIAVGFAMSSMTARKAAANNANATATRLLAQSGSNRVMGLMSDTFTDTNVSTGSETHYYPGTCSDTFLTISGVNTNMNDRRALISYYTDTTTPDTDFVDTGLSVAFSSNTTPDSTFADVDWDSSNLPVTWNYIKVNDGTSDQIVGRVAYLIFDESGKIDPNCVSSKSSAVARPGVSSNEITWGNAAGILSSTDLDTSTTGKIYSWEHMAKHIDSADIDAANKVLFPMSIPDREAYVDTPTGTEYNRFNLARTDWNDLDGDSSSTDHTDHVNVILSIPSTFTGTDTDGYGIFWLKNWDEAGTFIDKATCSEQIAANLIDYCDSDNVSTSDSADWTTTAPTYTGLEKTPYINEIAVFFQATTKIDTNATKYDIYYTFDAKVGVEVIDIYGITIPTIFKILDGTLSFKYRKNDGTFQTVDIDLASDANYNDTSRDISIAGTANYKMVFETVDIPNVTYINTVTSTAEVKDVSVRINKAMLTYAGDNADYVKPDIDTSATQIPNLGGGPPEFDVAISGASTTKTDQVWFSYQVEDPRQNLNDGDWEPPTYTNDTGAYGVAGTNGTQDLKNYCNGASISPASGNDTETTTDPASGLGDGGDGTLMSTAYIQNAPMKSPWELGAIHRGAKWETINLKDYKTMGGVSTAGGGAYSSGDANILDQIKMTNNAKNSGKININTPYTDVLKALLKTIHAGGNYSNPGTTALGVELTDTQISNLVTAIQAQNGTSGGAPFTDRAQVVNATALSNDTAVTSQNTDALKEEVIGKFINLTSVGQNYFSAIIISQAIKDVGIPYSATNTDGPTIIKNVYGASTGGTDANTYINNFSTNYPSLPNDKYSVDPSDDNVTVKYCQKGRYDRFVDEVISEQKILTFFYRDVFRGKWKLLNYKYLED